MEKKNENHHLLTISQRIEAFYQLEPEEQQQAHDGFYAELDAEIAAYREKLEKDKKKLLVLSLFTYVFVVAVFLLQVYDLLAHPYLLARWLDVLCVGIYLVGLSINLYFQLTDNNSERAWEIRRRTFYFYIVGLVINLVAFIV